MKTLWIASDHAGFDLKNDLITLLKNLNLDHKLIIHDLGPFDKNSVDYPDYADLVCQRLNPNLYPSVTENQQIGVLICGSGQGMAIRANKFLHVRAALIYNDEIAKLSREHNNANTAIFGSRFCTSIQTLKWLQIFLETEFDSTLDKNVDNNPSRHALRVAKLSRPTS